jgi:hypothetical protein
MINAQSAGFFQENNTQIKYPEINKPKIVTSYDFALIKDQFVTFQVPHPIPDPYKCLRLKWKKGESSDWEVFANWVCCEQIHCEVEVGFYYDFQWCGMLNYSEAADNEYGHSEILRVNIYPKWWVNYPKSQITPPYHTEGKGI